MSRMFKTALAIALSGIAFSAAAAADTGKLQIFQSKGAPGMCLSLEVGAVAIRPCTDSASQGFLLFPTFKGDGTQLIIGNTGLMMGAENVMLTSKFLGGSEQSTGFALGKDGSISSGGLCVDVKGGGRQSGTPVIAFRCNGQVNQRWALADSARSAKDVRAATRDARTTAKLSANHAPGNCLGPNGANELVIQSCSGAPTYMFTGGGRSTSLIQQGGSLCITPPGKSGLPILLKACAGEASTVWGLSDTGLLRSNDGLCADVKGGGKASGTPVVAFKCSGNSNQRFTLIP